MYRFFYIFNQFNEIAKSKTQQNKYIKVKKKKKKKLKNQLRKTVTKKVLQETGIL